MMIAVITNGGILFMVYPALVFGIALCDEERPGKKFWYFVIFYTQFIILLQYVAQLSIWTDPASKGAEIMNWSNRVNLGIVVIQDDVQQKYT
jgi:disulfide bond formation protein DsbB